MSVYTGVWWGLIFGLYRKDSWFIALPHRVWKVRTSKENTFQLKLQEVDKEKTIFYRQASSSSSTYSSFFHLSVVPSPEFRVTARQAPNGRNYAIAAQPSRRSRSYARRVLPATPLPAASALHRG